MNSIAAALETLGEELAGVVEAAFADDGLRLRDDDEVLAALAAAGRLQRAAEALMSEAVAQVLERDDLRAHPDRVTTRHGCRNVGELVERATQVSARTASDVIATAKAVGRHVAVSTGELLPAEFPRIRDALRDGQVGVDGVVGIVGAFRGC